MVERWNAVADRGNIEMHAWFNVIRESDRSWDVDESSWRFKGEYLRMHRVLGVELYLPPPSNENHKFDLIVQEYASPSMLLGYLVSRGISDRVAFRALPTYDAWIKRRRHKELLKHLLFMSVDAAKTGGPTGQTMFSKYGLPTEKIHPVTQSIDYRHFSHSTEVEKGERAALRASLGLKGCVFVYVGRLWKKKGLDDLFDAYRMLVNDAQVDTSLLLIGDGIDEAHFRLRAKELRDVVFAGFVQRADLPRMLSAADVLVFPTLGDPHGLVVEESMAAGLPVICTDAAGDIERRLPNGEAGFIVPTRDPATLATRMTTLQADPELRIRMGRRANEIARMSDHQEYARTFENFVDATLSSPPNRHPLGKFSRVAGLGINAIRSRL
ncbi:MAG: glycosyltransferase family 4 protein [Thermomicrobiales bacterium]